MEEEEGVGPNWHTNSHSKEVVDGVEAADEAFHLRMEAFDDWYTEKKKEINFNPKKITYFLGYWVFGIPDWVVELAYHQHNCCFHILDFVVAVVAAAVVVEVVAVVDVIVVQQSVSVQLLELTNVVDCKILPGGYFLCYCQSCQRHLWKTSFLWVPSLMTRMIQTMLVTHF